MGQTFELEDGRRAAKKSHPTARIATTPSDAEPVAQYREELVTMRAQIAKFIDEDPSDILALLSGIAGRLSEVRANLHRLNSQRATSLRVQEVDPLRDDIELQFKIWSRKIALMEWELRMSGGGI